MKKLTILLTLAALSATGANADLTIGSFPAKVVYGKTCVQIGEVDPGFVYDFSATKSTAEDVTVTTGFIKDGKIINEAALVGVDNDKSKLGYFDLSRLANGYQLIFSTGSASSDDEYDTTTINNGGTVNWGDQSKSAIEIKAPEGYTFREGDYIVVHRITNGMEGWDGNDCENVQGQLYFEKDGKVCKYGWTDRYNDDRTVKLKNEDDTNWLNNEGHRSDCQEIKWYNNNSKAFSFYVDSQIAEILNDSDTTVYFNGQACGENQTDLKIASIVVERKKADTSSDADACISGLTVTKTETVFSEISAMENMESVLGYISDGWGNIDVTEYFKTAGAVTNGTELNFTTGSASGQGQIIVVNKESNGNFKQEGDYYWHKYADKENVSGGDYDGADCKDQGDNNTYTINLNEKAAAAVNEVINSTDNGYKILFCCEHGTSLTAISVGDKEYKASTETKEGEWKLINLWNAKADNLIPDEGFDAGKWGFSSWNDGYTDYDGKADAWARSNNTHDIKQVETYFNSERGLGFKDSWMDKNQVLTPEYWAVILPRFVASPNDKIIMAIEVDLSNAYNQEWGGDMEKNTMQVWNVQTDAEGKLVPNILKWGDDVNAGDNESWKWYDRTLPTNTDDGKRYITLPLNSNGLSANDVEIMENGIRIKGQYFRIHRVDLIHFDEQIVIEPTTTTESYVIHVKPDAIKTHYLWNLVNCTSDKWLPSQHETLNHDGQSIDSNDNGDTKHAFIDKFELNFNTLADNTNIDNVGTTVQIDVNVYNEEGSQFPIAEYVTKEFASDHQSTSFNIGSLVMSDAKCYVDWDNKSDRTPRYTPVMALENNHFTGQHHLTMNVAGYETYLCTCGDCNGTSAKTWYKPMAELIKYIETNGIYIRVTTTRTEEPSAKRSRANAKAATENVEWPTDVEHDNVLNLDFKQLPNIDGTNYGDPQILYSGNFTDDNKLPWLVFNRIGMINNTNIGTGVENISIESDINAPAEYFNMSGMRVNGDNLTPGIYIIRQGSKTTKILVR